MFSKGGVPLFLAAMLVICPISRILGTEAIRHSSGSETVRHQRRGKNIKPVPELELVLAINHTNTAVRADALFKNRGIQRVNPFNATKF